MKQVDRKIEISELQKTSNTVSQCDIINIYGPLHPTRTQSFFPGTHETFIKVDYEY